VDVSKLIMHKVPDMPESCSLVLLTDSSQMSTCETFYGHIQIIAVQAILHPVLLCHLSLKYLIPNCYV
jgi:hypothetical protein